MAQAIRALGEATGQEVKLVPPDFKLHRQSEGDQKTPTHAGPRPDLDFIKKWVNENGGTYARQHDGSYDAIVDFADPNAEFIDGVSEGNAWEQALFALKDCPRPGLVLFKQIRILLSKSSIDRWKANPKGSSLSQSQKPRDGNIIATPEAEYIVIPTMYVAIGNEERLLGFLEGEEAEAYEGQLDRGRATLNLFWGPPR